MLLSRGGDYAVRAMVYLASRPPDGKAITEEIAAKQNIPPAFLSKVLARLTQAGLVRTYRGAAGGVGLARPPEEISLLEVVEAVQGPIVLNECTSPHRTCSMEGDCHVTEVWKRAQKELEETLRKATLARLPSA